MATARQSHVDPSDRFYLWAPIDIEEPLEKGVNGELPPFVPVSGIITAEIWDADRELMDRDGIWWGLFKSHGRLTDGHPATSANVVGEPTDLLPVEIRLDGHDGLIKAMHMKGKLYLGTEENPCVRGRRIYRDHKAMLASGAKHGYGFSVEGQALQRNPTNRRHITKAVITSVALDAQPKNGLSWMDQIAAAMGSAASEALGVDVADIAAAYMRDHIPANLGVRSDLLKGISDDEIRVLRLLRRNPDSLTFAEGQRHLDEIIRQRGL